MFLTDFIFLFLVIGTELAIGVLVTRYIADHPSKIPSFARLSFAIIVLVILAITAAAAVVAEHGERVWNGVRSGVWVGALFGAWMTTRKKHDEVQLSEALRRGIAETLDGALVGAVVGAVVFDAAEAWKGASLGAVLGSSGWALGRLFGVTLPSAPFPTIVRAVENFWIEMRSLKAPADCLEVSIVSMVAEALTGALIGASCLSLMLAALSGWGFYNLHN